MKTLSFFVLLSLLLACGGDQLNREGAARPSWLNKGSAARKDGAFYGVGVADKISSIGLRRSTADARARVELAKLFSSRVQNLIKNYEASTSDGKRESPEAHHQEVIKIFSEMELTGVDIVDRYYDKEERVQYSLARLAPDSFEEQLDRMGSLNKKARKIIRDNARQAFKELDEESAKRR